MKKLMIVHHSSVIGGAGISLFNLIQLASKDYDITVYVSNLYDDYYNLLLGSNINVKQYDGRIPAIYYHASSGGLFTKAFWHRLVLMLIKYKYWKKTIQDSNADLIIVNSLVLCWMSVIASKKNIKSLCFVRETFAYDGEGFVSEIQRKFLGLFTSVSFISKYDLKISRLPETVKTFVNHNYIISKKTEQISKNNKDIFTVLYIGGMSKIKGIEVVIEAAKILNYLPDIKFNIVGEDYSRLLGEKFKIMNLLNKNFKLSKKIKEQVKENNLEETVIFHGIQKEMQQFFELSDVLICPIITPHQQRGIFEAGWYSKPVIVSNFEQLHWSVKKGYNGEFFDPENAEALADKILKLYHNRALCKQQGLHNNEFTLKNHTMERSLNKILLTLKKTLDAKNK
jgi:glycosyltransferase involved in cell wall biosynthesis